MQRTDFQFELPPELIAQYPSKHRTASRLLMLNANSGALADRQFSELLGFLKPNDLLVFNNTKVLPARFLGEKETGGKVEVLVERVLDDKRVLAHIRSSKSPSVGRMLRLETELRAEVLGRHEALFELQFDIEGDVIKALEQFGRLPLPPYIDREVDRNDLDRYQTVYAKQIGAVAAPTAGLHFDNNLMQRIHDSGIDMAEVTLHIGAGTFQPVRVEDIRTHKMHSERIEVSEVVCEKVRQTREKGGRVIAIGTTSVRALESASCHGKIAAYSGETDIFIYPGYQFRSVDAMVTNFHLSESTLLMLVSAFAGRDHTMSAYQHAIEQRYRFFSYGDAMFITGENA